MFSRNQVVQVIRSQGDKFRAQQQDNIEDYRRTT